MATLTDRLSWQASAACRGKEREVFFLEDSSSVQEAKSMCAACPVQENCLTEYFSEPHGVFGGLTAEERKLNDGAHRDWSRPDADPLHDLLLHLYTTTRRSVRDICRELDMGTKKATAYIRRAGVERTPAQMRQFDWEDREARHAIRRVENTWPAELRVQVENYLIRKVPLDDTAKALNVSRNACIRVRKTLVSQGRVSR